MAANQGHFDVAASTLAPLADTSSFLHRTLSYYHCCQYVLEGGDSPVPEVLSRSPKLHALVRRLLGQGLWIEAIEAFEPDDEDFSPTPRPSDTLCRFLAQGGALAELEALAGEGDWTAAECMAQLLVADGREDELNAWATRLPAMKHVIDSLRMRRAFDNHDTGELTRLHQEGSSSAARYLATLLIELKQWDELERLSASDWQIEDAFRRHQILLLMANGKFEEARQRAPIPYHYLEPLATHLASQGRFGEVVDVMRMARDDFNYSDGEIPQMVCNLLYRHGRIEELRALAAQGNGFAQQRVLWYLMDHGRIDELLRHVVVDDLGLGPFLQELPADQRLQYLAGSALWANGLSASGQIAEQPETEHSHLRCQRQ